MTTRPRPTDRGSDGDPADLTFDGALGVLLAMIGQRVVVDVFDAGEHPRLVATFGGTLHAGYSMTGGEPNEQEAIFVRLDSGAENAALSLHRELYGGAISHPDGALTLRLGGVDLLIAPRER